MKFLSKYEVYIRLLAFTVIAAVILSIYASSNTLVYNCYEFDYAIFKVIGKAWSQGQLPYRDIFDQKGPFMFLTQMIAFMVPVPKLGTWLLELICVAVTCEILFRCGLYIGASKRLCYISVLAMLACYARYVDGGDTVEILSLPFETLPLLMLFRYLFIQKSLPLTAFVSGMCFGIVAMIRLNNNAIIAGIAIGMVIYLCRRQEFCQLAKCAGLFLGGMSLTIVPFLVYFLSAGALDDMIYCILKLGVLYMKGFGDVAHSSPYYNIITLLPCVLFVITLVIYGGKKGLLLPTFLIMPPIFTFLTIYSSLGFNHYFLMEIPFVALGIQLSWPFNRYFKAAVIVSFLYLGARFITTYTGIGINRIKERLAEEAVSCGVIGQRFVSEYIPDSDKTSVYVFGNITPARALIENGFLPVGKYFFQQESYSLLEKKVHDDIIKNFIEAHPKWIIAESEDISLLKGNMDDFCEIPRDSLPYSCPGFWHVYVRK